MSIRSRCAGLLGNAGLILLFALVAGLLFPRAAVWTKLAVVPVLGVVMTLSVLSISSEILLDLRRLPRPILASIVLNYLLLGGAFIGLSALIIQDQGLSTGFILVAAVPPAVAVIPYTHHLGGNVAFSLVGTVATYLAALVLTPLMCILFLGTNYLEPWRLFMILVELIVAPLLLSRLLRRLPFVSILEKYRGHVVNWGFFVIVYTIVGLNRQVFLEQPETLLRVSAVGFVCTFVLAELIDRVSNRLGVDEPTRTSLLLLGTRKNYGLASAIAVVFFDNQAAVPSTVGTVFAIIHFIWLNLRHKRKGH
jgi:BASS family bile acid:Na+ symporter